MTSCFRTSCCARRAFPRSARRSSAWSPAPRCWTITVSASTFTDEAPPPGQHRADGRRRSSSLGMDPSRRMSSDIQATSNLLHSSASGPYVFDRADFGRSITMRRNPVLPAVYLPLKRGRHNFDTPALRVFRRFQRRLRGVQGRHLHLPRLSPRSRSGTRATTSRPFNAGAVPSARRSRMAALPAAMPGSSPAAREVPGHPACAKPSG